MPLNDNFHPRPTLPTEVHVVRSRASPGADPAPEWGTLGAKSSWTDDGEPSRHWHDVQRVSF